MGKTTKSMKSLVLEVVRLYSIQLLWDTPACESCSWLLLNLNSHKVATMEGFCQPPISQSLWQAPPNHVHCRNLVP